MFFIACLLKSRGVKLSFFSQSVRVSLVFRPRPLHPFDLFAVLPFVVVDVFVFDIERAKSNLLANRRRCIGADLIRVGVLADIGNSIVLTAR